jgi:hypothetical protein
MAMVVVPSGAFHAGHDDVAAITTAYDTLAPLLGAPAASAFLEAADFGKGSEWWSLEQQPVAYYRTAAARAGGSRRKPRHPGSNSISEK